MRPSRRQLLVAAAAAALAGCANHARRAALPAPPPTSGGAATGGTATGVPAAAAPTGSPASSARARPTATTRPHGPAREVVHGSRNRAEVALTFHGAGPTTLATALLEAAERAGARVTVFAIGDWLVANPRMAARILAGGHGLANHTYTHPEDMASLPAAAAQAEFAKARAVLLRQARSDGGYARPSAMSRATPTVLDAAGRAGYPTVLMYDVDPSDYLDPGAGAVGTRVLSTVRPGSVISLHLGHPGTVTALPVVLRGLAARRLRPVTVAELLRA